MLIIHSCHLISSETNNDLTGCVLICHEEVNENISPNVVHGGAVWGLAQ